MGGDGVVSDLPSQNNANLCMTDDGAKKKKEIENKHATESADEKRFDSLVTSERESIPKQSQIAPSRRESVQCDLCCPFMCLELHDRLSWSPTRFIIRRDVPPSSTHSLFSVHTCPDWVSLLGLDDPHLSGRIAKKRDRDVECAIFLSLNGQKQCGLNSAYRRNET